MRKTCPRSGGPAFVPLATPPESGPGEKDKGPGSAAGPSSAPPCGIWYSPSLLEPHPCHGRGVEGGLHFLVQPALFRGLVARCPLCILLSLDTCLPSPAGA